MAKGTEIEIDSRAVGRLLKAVEGTFGRPLHSPADFMLLCDDIEESVGQLISLSTIKRIWGYVACDYTPRITTLSILARYAGYADWPDFLVKSDADNNQSGFIGGKTVLVEDLSPGEEVIFAWHPDRRCRARYIGGSCFKVAEAENAKIEPGDTFSASIFAPGLPLYITNVVKASGEIHNFYIAGKEHGLSSVAVRRR